MRWFLILILEQYPNTLTDKLAETLNERGLTFLRLTPSDIIYKLNISFNLNNEVCYSEMNYDSLHFSSDDLSGVYSEIDRFPTESLSFFSNRDAEYAINEWHSFWFNILKSLNCPIVNPPNMEALGGTLLSPVELFDSARKHGLNIQTIVEVESGNVAAEFIGGKSRLSYIDLGCEYCIERPLHTEIVELQQVDHQIRLREHFVGNITHIALIGDQPFSIQWNDHEKKFTNFNLSDFPSDLFDNLMELHKSMNLIVADYQFISSVDGEWFFSGLVRHITEETLALHGEIIINAIVDLISGKEKTL